MYVLYVVKGARILGSHLLCAAAIEVPDAQRSILGAAADLVAVGQLHHPAGVQGVAPQYLRGCHRDLTVENQVNCLYRKQISTVKNTSLIIYAYTYIHTYIHTLLACAFRLPYLAKSSSICGWCSLWSCCTANLTAVALHAPPCRSDSSRSAIYLSIKIITTTTHRHYYSNQ